MRMTGININALAAYRHVLRSTRIAFQGDIRLLNAARREARKKFDTNRSLSSSSHEAAAGIMHAEDVARILRQNVVQGERLDEEGEKYQLRIRKETERGDNDTIKKAGRGLCG
ncbi:MAG: mitochondrial zinc maintenance mitochondrial [Lasallia pustulata]|uniref:Mitochondrial zinc maintenance protein 1, mitochondrial n=1 Tax=Lasallia pustulata TaxID=136370 RepID=A0A5M8PUS8_9LECA|nr:MAG: mitochondrial zinc maintenance mitochondrial [Lasallia pustulata]